MPIPQLKSNFSKRKISDINPRFSHRPISEISKPKKNKFSGRILHPSNILKTGKKRPRMPRLGGSKRGFKSLIRRLWPYILGLVFLGGILIIAMFAWYSRDLPEPGKIMDRSVALSTKIYDRTGEILLYEIHGPENRTLVEIENLPKYVVEATIAIEDKNFYNHGGFSVWAMFRTLVTNIIYNQRAGGSTLTQQFVKNAVLTPEKKVTRKIKEIVLSYRLEKKFSKDEILQMYLNEIPYGSNAYGVEAASLKYFGKNAKDISIAEAALLAALVQSPTRYSPYGPNKDLLIGRKDYVITLMAEQGYISEDEEATAKQEEIVFAGPETNITAPHFVMYIKNILSNPPKPYDKYQSK